MSIDAMKQALAALDVATTPLRKDRITVLEAKEALRAAIEAAERQEPEEDTRFVGWDYTAPQPAIPDGMVLVPKAFSAKMSHRMGYALHKLFGVSGENDRYSRLWFELLDAASKPGGAWNVELSGPPEAGPG